MMKRRRRPRDDRQRPIRPVNPSANEFDWTPEIEPVVGVGKTRGLSVLDRVRALYGPSETDGGAD
jgi:hypothetical protein